MNADHESLAAIELERHRPQMLYAERQLLKKGEYEALALSLVKRSRLRLWGSVVAATAVGVSGHWVHVAMGVAILFAAMLDYSHTQRTLATIQALGGADEPAKPS
jgi:hypothetical protein